MDALTGRLFDLIQADGDAMAQLRVLRRFALPQGRIGAGFVRNRVWDALSGNAAAPGGDVDVLFFDPADATRARDRRLDAAFSEALPGVDWQVRNQARMHRLHGDAPYACVEDALRHWLETATAVAVWLDGADRLHCVAPWGLDDLFSLVLRPSPTGRRRPAELLARMDAKGWRRRWPGLRLAL